MPTTQVGSHIAFYDDLGNGHPVLFLTGLGGSRFGWWKQIEPFWLKYRIINMDNRDGGDSAQAQGPYTIADMADDSAGVLKNLNIAKTHVIGISMGGMIAQELTLRHPELVDKLVLVSTGAGGPSNVPPSPEIGALLMRGAEEDLATRVKNTYTIIAGPGYMKAHPEDLQHIVDTALAKPMSLESYQRQLGACFVHMSGGTAARLNQITAPTLVIHGDCDPLIPYPNGKFLSENIKGARLSTYPGVGHLSMIEAPERFNREVMDFLS